MRGYIRRVWPTIPETAELAAGQNGTNRGVPSPP